MCEAHEKPDRLKRQLGTLLDEYRERAKGGIFDSTADVQVGFAIGLSFDEDLPPGIDELKRVIAENVICYISSIRCLDPGGIGSRIDSVQEMDWRFAWTDDVEPELEH